MGLISTNYHHLVTQAHLDVQDVLVAGSRVSMKEAFLESRLVSTTYLVLAVGRSFFLAFGELNRRNWPEKDWELVGTQLKMTFVALALILPTAVAPKRFYLWLIPEDSPLLEDKTMSNLYAESVRMRHERNVLSEQLELKNHLLELLLHDEREKQQLVQLSMSLMNEIKQLKEELNRRNPPPEMSQHLEGLYETIRLGVKVLGKKGSEIVLVQLGHDHSDTKEIFLKTPKDWGRFIKRMKEETDHCRRLIDEAVTLPEERIGSVRIRTSGVSREIHYRQEDTMQQLRELAQSVPSGSLSAFS